MLSELGTELQRARLHGFGEREIANARTMLLAAAEEGVRRESTRPARDVLRDLNRDVSRQRPPVSAAQTLALFQRLLPGITAREVSDSFATSFDPSRALFVAELPSGDQLPSEADLVAAGRGIAMAGAADEQQNTREGIAWVALADAPQLRVAVDWRADERDPAILAYLSAVRDVTAQPT